MSFTLPAPSTFIATLLDDADAATARTTLGAGTSSVSSKSDIGLSNVDNTSDTNKPVSTATQTALDLKAPLASPAFTGTPTGITKTHVGLGSVDNTADTAKPVSTAQQTALDLKANAANPVFTGTMTVPDGALAIADTSGLQAALDGKASTAHRASHLAGGSDALGGLPICDYTVSDAQTISSTQRCVTFGVVTVNALVTVNGLWVALTQLTGI